MTQPGGHPILSVDQATKRFGGVVAVQDISFDVRAGEVAGLIGPNGAGKTTLINLITGIARPTSGQLVFQGRRLNGLAAHTIGRLGVARTFQVVHPFANLTIRENVAVGAMYGAGGAHRSTPAAFEKADEVLEFVHLAERRLDPAESLSIAGRKRLELAKALAMDPTLLLLDEVMAGLRGREIDDAIDLVGQISARGITLLVIEHVMKVIMGICQRVIVLDYGRKIAEGTPQEVTTNPEVIRAYLGSAYGRTAESPTA